MLPGKQLIFFLFLPISMLYTRVDTRVAQMSSTFSEQLLEISIIPTLSSGVRSSHALRVFLFAICLIFDLLLQSAFSSFISST